MEQISFIHVADLHLDSPFQGLSHIPEHIFREVRESTFVALDRLVRNAIHLQVDFVLIVGDLFDNERQSLKAQIRLRKAFEELEKHHINVYLSYGNHDHINGNIHSVTYPDNVYIFPSEQVSTFTYQKNGIPMVELHGFSYENRAVLTNKTAEYQANQQNALFHIALLHGSLQSNTEHDTYAPFQLSELVHSDFDYWALGHIHQRSILKEDPPIVYSGNTQGRHRKETGEKGCYHVVLSEANTDLTFIPLQALQFTNRTIDVSTCTEVNQLENLIYNQIQHQYQQTTPQLIDLTLVSHQQNLYEWKNNGYLAEMIEIVNDTFVDQTNWNYIFRYAIKVERTSDDQMLAEGSHFIGELSRQFTEQSMESHLSELYQHRQGRKYLETLSEAEKVAVKDEAQQLLIHELLAKGGE
ncbi:MAG TPA: DNA repair exonuclease [Candidatus Dormibacteraeota bacterium]|nr:DNA repair exonuclease [Candidatus Dormibacteraeota bacterium]